MLSPEVIAQAERRVGQTIGGKWHLDRVIGVGGMAAVYEATHRNRNRVAIKLLHPVLSLDEGTRHRFLREGYVANTIRHEGAVQVLDDDLTEEGVAFLVMELLIGETVEDRMDRKGGALDVPEALELMEQLLDVLCVAHDQGVIHRDIKPDNLFLTEGGRLKVLDFGIARLHQGDTRSTRAGSFMGTPAYCAPEQARGRWDEVDARTDLFSVAATLFAAITGDHVHPAETSSEQLALAIGATARSLSEALPQAPAELVEFVDKALSYNKEDRFQSARAMKAAIARVRAGLKDSYIPPPRKSFRPSSSTFHPSDSTTMAGGVDSFFPSIYPARSKVRILVGLLAAGVVATFLLIATQRSDGVGTPASVPTVEASAREAKPTEVAASADDDTPEADVSTASVVDPEESDAPAVRAPDPSPTPTVKVPAPRENPKVTPRSEPPRNSIAEAKRPPAASFPDPTPPPPPPPPQPEKDPIFGSRF